MNLRNLGLLLALLVLGWLALAHWQSHAKSQTSAGPAGVYNDAGDWVAGNGDYARVDQIAGNPSM